MYEEDPNNNNHNLNNKEEKLANKLTAAAWLVAITLITFAIA